MKVYNGTVRIRLHADKGITLDKGNESSTLTAADARIIADKMVEFATQHKCGIDRWCLYIPEVSEKLAKDDKQLPVAKVKAALKDANNVPVLRKGRFSPRLDIAPEVKVTKRESKYQDLA